MFFGNIKEPTSSFEATPQKRSLSEPPDISFSVKAYELIDPADVAILGIDGIVEKTKFGPSLIKKFHGESSQEWMNRPGEFYTDVHNQRQGDWEMSPQSRRGRNAPRRKRRDWGESSTSETGYFPSKKEGKGDKSACGSACKGDRIFSREAEVDGNSIAQPGSKERFSTT